MIKVGDQVKIVNYNELCEVLQVTENQIIAASENVKFICGLDCVDFVVHDVKGELYVFSDLRVKQMQLTKLAIEKSGVSEIPIHDLLMWLLVEVGEALNEARFFKYCRNKDINRDKLLEELTDCLFMFLELDNLVNFMNNEYSRSFKNTYGYHSIDVVDDISMEFSHLIREVNLAFRSYKRGDIAYKCKLYDAMNTFVSILKYYNISNDEIHSMYNRKYEINIDRLKSL